MNGALLPHTPIAVDFWQIRRCSHVRLFFLSHMHSDHTVGLSSTWKQPLYCSPVTAKILKHKLQVKSKWINPLEVGVCHMLPLDDCGIETMAVTLIDANHCPGSVMFLFEGYFGTILYTGDFRYSSFMVKYPPLRNKKIDVLYLDNTNCDPGHKLPSRQEATKQIKEIIDNHPCHDVVIGLYSIGKESLLVDLAQTFQTWVVVSPQRMELLTILETENVFETLDGAGRFHAVEQSEIKYANMVKWNCVHPTIAILPTSRKVKVRHKDIYVVPYSDHSSYDELIDFVSQIKPCSIIPVVKTQECMSHFKQYLSSEMANNCVKIPNSVKEFMKRQELSSTVNSKKLKVVRKSNPRGVEFESPEKSLQYIVDCDGFGDKLESTPKSADHKIHSEEEYNIGHSYLDSEHDRAPIPLTESTVLVSNKDRTPLKSCSDNTRQFSENEFEMPSAIWTPKDMNLTVLSDSSVLYKEARTLVSPNTTTSPESSQHLFSFTRADGLSILPCTKRRNFDSRHFHHQVERYLENCIH